MLPIVPPSRSKKPSSDLRGFIAAAILLTLAITLVAQPQLVPEAQAAGTTYYVATTGNDNNNGLTISTAWKTIQRAMRTLTAGDTLLIGGGVYTDEKIRPENSGTADHYITIQPYNSETVTIQGNYGDDWAGIGIEGKSYLRIEGLVIRGFHTGVTCKAPGHHIVLKDNTLEYNSEAGILSSDAASGSENGCDYLTIEGNTIHHNGYYDNGQPATRYPAGGWSSGISLHPNFLPHRYDTVTSRFHTIIRGNRIYHNYDGSGGDSDDDADHTEGHGVILDRTGADMPPVLIENNVIFDNGGKCINALGAQNFWFVGNTCYRNSTDSLWKNPEDKAEIAAYPFYTEVPVRNVHILDNIAYALDGQRITDFPDTNFDDSDALDMRNNLWFGTPPHDPYACPYGEEPICSDPLFVNPSVNPTEADFHLKAQSPAIDRGLSEFEWSDMQLIDFDGTTRPQGAGYDIGAYESTASYESAPSATKDFFVWLPYVVSPGSGICRY